MDEHICAYCSKTIEKPEDGVFDRLSGSYFHNAQSCPYRSKDLPKLPQISESRGGVTCFNLLNLVSFEEVRFDLVAIIKLEN